MASSGTGMLFSATVDVAIAAIGGSYTVPSGKVFVGTISYNTTGGGTLQIGSNSFFTIFASAAEVYFPQGQAMQFTLGQGTLVQSNIPDGGFHMVGVLYVN